MANRHRDPVGTFNAAGLRWAFQTLSARTEVASVMGEMLGSIEYWKLSNELGACKFKLEQEHQHVIQLEQKVAELDEARRQQEEQAQHVRETSRSLRDKLVEEMQELARGLKAKAVLERRVAEMQRALERMPALEKELQRAQRELKDAQRRAGEMRTVSLPLQNGRSRAAFDRLVNGHTAPVGRGPGQKHTFLNTITMLEEKVLLKVFSYMTAQDVLSTAEVCKPFYDRVGLIFGKASSSGTTDGSAQMTRAGSSVGGSPTTNIANIDQPLSKASAAAKAVLDDVPLTDKVANAIASKLSGAELKGIIAMTEKLKKLEGVLMQMQAENEDIRARLQGAESVKDFLITKLKDTEVLLKKQMDGNSAFARQRASDQEVISFLDGRVQELELALRQTADRLAEIQEQQQKDKLISHEQVRVLKDMVTYEKHKFEEAEAQWKNQKKLLAREIKSLRNECQARMAERDLFQEELRSLRQSLSSYRR